MTERSKGELDASASPSNRQALDYDDIDITVECDNLIHLFSKELAHKIVLEAKIESCNNLTKRCIK